MRYVLRAKDQRYSPFRRMYPENRGGSQGQSRRKFEPNVTSWLRNAFLHPFLPVKNNSAPLTRTHERLRDFRIQESR